jgi:peptidoglycan/xylan/chitin deacetylase (PgdA/CDA1 family)
MSASRTAPVSGFVKLLERAGGARSNMLAVLMYHRVDEPAARPDLDPSLLSATPNVFEQQMRHVAEHHHVVSMSQLLDALRGEAELPPRSVMITFDDAYCDFAQHSWPILKRYGLPVTVFVPTAYPDHPERAFWWDRLHHAIVATRRRQPLRTPVGLLPLASTAERERTRRRLCDYVKAQPHGRAMAWVDRLCSELDAPRPAASVLGWDALRRLAGEGVTLGAHTRTHPLMNRVTPAEAHAEAAGSLQDLRREIGTVPAVFAYPGGALNGAVARAVEHAGFHVAFTTARGINDLAGADRLRLRRINVGRRTTETVLRAQLLPCSVYLNRLPMFRA